MGSVPVSRPRGSLEAYLLGTVDYDSALFLQRRAAFEIGGFRDGRAAVFVCEHPPLITVGRHGTTAHILAEPRDLVARQIRVRWVARGGGCVVHGPGQLAVYPIIPLSERGLGLSEYVRRLQRCLGEAARELGVHAAHILTDATGLWGRHGQIAAIGAAVHHGVTLHGMFLNVSIPLDLLWLVRPPPLEKGTVPFAAKHPAGRSGKTGLSPFPLLERASSLTAERGRPAPMHLVRESILRHLAEQLGFDRVHLYSGHPLLVRERRPYVAAARA